MTEAEEYEIPYQLPYIPSTIVSDLDPTQIFPMETEEDLEKFEVRAENWYSLIGQLLELKSSPQFRMTPTNRLGVLYHAIEQYCLVLATKGIIEAKQYWPAVEAAKAKQTEMIKSVKVTITQVGYASVKFTAKITQAGEPEPLFSQKADRYQAILKHIQQAIRVRRWECENWVVQLADSDPALFEKPDTLEIWLAQQVDEQENQAILDQESS
jgi:hypothetical protein